MHYKRKNLIVKSRDFVRRYLHDDVTGWIDYAKQALYVAVKQKQTIWKL